MSPDSTAGVRTMLLGIQLSVFGIGIGVLTAQSGFGRGVGETILVLGVAVSAIGYVGPRYAA